MLFSFHPCLKLILFDSSHPEYGYSTIAFRKAVLDSQPEAVRAFLAAVEKAVELINEDPGRWNKLLSEKQIVPDPVSGSYVINPYPTGSVPTELQYQHARIFGLIMEIRHGVEQIKPVTNRIMLSYTIMIQLRLNSSIGIHRVMELMMIQRQLVILGQ